MGNDDKSVLPDYRFAICTFHASSQLTINEISATAAQQASKAAVKARGMENPFFLIKYSANGRLRSIAMATIQIILRSVTTQIDDTHGTFHQ
jgi:hypothetical protein